MSCTVYSFLLWYSDTFKAKVRQNIKLTLALGLPLYCKGYWLIYSSWNRKPLFLASLGCSIADSSICTLKI